MGEQNPKLEAAVRRYREPVTLTGENHRRVLMDMTMTAGWLRAGVMVGITRACSELYIALRRKTPVMMVTLTREGGKSVIRRIDDKTLLPSGEVITPQKGDLLIMAEIQVRGVHVPVNYPAVGFLEELGVDRCAVVYDILPILYPQYFEPATAQGMPDYVTSLFRNFNMIICDSKAVCDTVERFWETGTVRTVEWEIEFGKTENPYPYMSRGWHGPEGGFSWTNGDAILSVFTGHTQGDLAMTCRWRTLAGAGVTRILCNGREIGCLDEEKTARTENLTIPAYCLRRDGVQEIRIVTEGAYVPASRNVAPDSRTLGVAIEKIRIEAKEPAEMPVREIVEKPVVMGFAHLGVTQFEQTDPEEPEEKLRRFMPEGGKERTYLMVGTVEPRKGHELALSVFDRMWKKGYTGKLCIIGGLGWNMDPFVKKLKKHAEFGRKLLFTERASDATLQYAYRHAAAVIQASADEGFGLPLIEAGRYGVPVLCSDIPVFHEVGGEHVLYFRRDEDGLEQALRDFEAMPAEQAPDSGKIASRSWDDYAADCYGLLMGEKEWPYRMKPAEASGPKRKKAVITMTYSVYPPLNGGQARVCGLYQGITEEYDVEIVSLVPARQAGKRQIIARGISETQVPKTEEHEKMEQRLERRVGVPATDTAMLLYADLTPAYAETFRKAAEDADLLIVCHPFTYPLVRKMFPEKPVIYEAQDVEYVIKKGMYQECRETEAALKQLYEAEKACCEDSRLIMTCSEEDKKTLAELYRIPEEKIIVVPNGVDTRRIRYVSVPERLKNKERVGLEKETVGVFMGSWHVPNLKAAEEVIRMAESCGQVKLLLMGSQCAYFKGKKLPENVGLLGLVTDGEKDRVLSIADFALNPITSGSGTNLKMFDYMAMGIPAITTPFGARGINRDDVFLTAEIDGMAETIRNFDLRGCEKMAEDARKYMEETFDWHVIAAAMLEKIRAVTEG